MGSDSKALIQRMRKWLEGRDGEGTWKKMGGWQNCGLGKRQNVEPAYRWTVERPPGFRGANRGQTTGAFSTRPGLVAGALPAR